MQHFQHDKDIFFITGSKKVSKLLAKADIHNEAAKLFVLYKSQIVNIKPLLNTIIRGVSLFIK